MQGSTQHATHAPAADLPPASAASPCRRAVDRHGVRRRVSRGAALQVRGQGGSCADTCSEECRSLLSTRGQAAGVVHSQQAGLRAPPCCPPSPPPPPAAAARSVHRGALHREIRTRTLHAFRERCALEVEEQGVWLLQGGQEQHLYNTDTEPLFR